MKFGQIVIGINLLLDHQASGAPTIAPYEIANNARPHALASQTAFGSNGVGLPLAHPRFQQTVRENFIKQHGFDPTTASHRELEEVMIPTASFYFPNPGGLDMGIGPEIFNAPYVPPGSVNVPEFTTETHKTVSNAHDENGFADLTHPQLAAVVGGSVAISTALVALGRLGYRAYLKYGRKKNIPIIPEKVTKSWNYLKSKMKRPTIPESKTSDLEMAEPGAITSVSKVDKPSAPLDTIGDMRDQVKV